MFSKLKLDNFGIPYLRFKVLNFFSSFSYRRSLIFTDMASIFEQMWFKSSGGLKDLSVSRKDS